MYYGVLYNIIGTFLNTKYFKGSEFIWSDTLGNKDWKIIQRRN